MKVTTYLTECRRKAAGQSPLPVKLGSELGGNGNAYLCFRLRDKKLDLKVRTDILVMSEYWDNGIPGYSKTRKVTSADRKKMNALVCGIIAKLTAEYDEETADAAWVKDTVNRCMNPELERRQSKPTFIDRYEQYLREHKMAKNSYNIYKATLKRLKRYEAYKREIGGIEGFHLYVETITADDYHDFEEYIQSEHELFKEYGEFYAQFGLKGRSVPKPMAIVGVVYMIRHLRTIHHWCIKQGYTSNKSCDQVPNPDPTLGTPVYITLEERDTIYNADLSSQCMSVRLARDFFMFQSLIGCRVGDLRKMTYSNIHDGVLTYIPHKTMERQGQAVDVPLNSKALEILARNDSNGHLLFPRHAVTTNTAALNKEIKRVFTLCGITRMVTVRNPVTGADEQKPINEIASSHMARRTFIGNLYKKVKDPSIICSMTGHTKGSRSFARYRDIDEDIKIELVNLIN